MPANSTRYLLLTLSFFSLLITIQTEAQTAIFNPETDTLTVALSGGEPFIIPTGDPKSPNGIAIEIWESIANKEAWTHRYKYFDNVTEALDALEKGTVNLVAGPIGITSQRIGSMSFTQPYYQSSLSIVSRINAPTFWEKIRPFFSFQLLIGVATFLILLATVGALLWLAERNKSPKQFPSNPTKGIGNGMWLAIVTMSTTGYGDMAPVTLRGRVIAGIWMIMAIVLGTSMVAGISSSLTVSSLGSNTITSIEQLRNKKVATIPGSTAETFLKEHNAIIIKVENLDSAIFKLKNREVEAIVYDRPELRYFLKNNAEKELYLAKAEYYPQGYGFAFPLKSSLINDVNRSLLLLSEDHLTERVINYYLGEQK